MKKLGERNGSKFDRLIDYAAAKHEKNDWSLDALGHINNMVKVIYGVYLRDICESYERSEDDLK